MRPPLDSPSSPVLPGEMPPPEAPTDQANVKGKQRAVDPIPPPSRRSHPKKQRKHREKRERVYTLRPILTIQRSQGFVWNQDLFVPPYIKDRCAFLLPSFVLPFCAPSSCDGSGGAARTLAFVVLNVASTSPPGSGFVSTSVSSTNSALTDYDNYEVEVVEIRVQEGEYAGIIPRP
ncbi:hypothetical protein MSAN_00447100 [Mycena sanguinolenta]|uniref:Uncharacterized protein n=1 Tax=Mycena sanguinolenta TaxID=230812 RepID=A0A8H6ZEV2_9AGAR|nr:hypothetical protein MSAN_00447100 [Mycena sanguinolenta]